MEACSKVIALGCILCTFPLFVHAQTVISFTIDDQPPSPFTVDAGIDQAYTGGELTIGGSPSATGGFEDYTFNWEPSAFLNDPNHANPIVSGITEPTTFTLTCTDIAGNCTKTDEVFVDYQLGVEGAIENSLEAYPNPFEDNLIIQADLSIHHLSLYDITGKKIRSLSSLADTYHLDTRSLYAGIYIVRVELTNGYTKNFRLCKRD